MVVKSLLVFFLAGLCEIGGGYLVWLWLKDNKPWWFGVAGAIILFSYGILATFQPANFGRVYVAYGGIFIAMSLIWGWKVDNIKPDKYDIIGACIALIGMSIIMFAPRKAGI
jgi:small multidrug resistance family-3 protein